MSRRNQLMAAACGFCEALKHGALLRSFLRSSDP